MSTTRQQRQNQPMDRNYEQVMHHYTHAYQQLYKRSPKDIQVLDNGWVSVNGAKMRVTELEFLTRQLQLEYNQARVNKRSIVKRLLNWFKQ